MKNRRTIKKIPIPQTLPSNIPTLPYNGSVVNEKTLTFSFSCFNRDHELFNLGLDSSQDGTVGGLWFLDLVDCLKDVSNKTITALCRSPSHQLHKINWNSANTAPPLSENQHEYWQFRISKGKGRVIGIKIDSTFYIVWLDPHHNLTNSEGYGKAEYYSPPKSEYELQKEEITRLKNENQKLAEEASTAYTLMSNCQDEHPNCPLNKKSPSWH